MELVKAHMKQAKYVSLMADMRTGKRMHSYIAMKTHTFIDCHPKSGLLQFAAFKGPHTSAEIDKTITSKDLKA